MMIWVAFAYGMIAYYYFHRVLQTLQPYDTTDTAILNTSMALTIGPLLLIPVLIYSLIYRALNYEYRYNS